MFLPSMDSLFGDLSNNRGLCPPVPSVHQLVFVPCYVPILFWLYNYQALLCTTHLATTKLICPCKLHLLMTVVDDFAAISSLLVQLQESSKCTHKMEPPSVPKVAPTLTVCMNTDSFQFCSTLLICILVTALCTRALASLRNSS